MGEVGEVGEVGEAGEGGEASEEGEGRDMRKTMRMFWLPKQRQMQENKPARIRARRRTPMGRPSNDVALWARRIALDRRRSATLTAQLVDGVVQALRRGELRRGERLPGARAWAGLLGVDRSTVAAATAELAAQGLVAGTARVGITVVATLPKMPDVRRARDEDALGFAIDDADDDDDNDDGDVHDDGDDGDDDDDRHGDRIELWGGTPDTRLVPRAVLARAVRRALLGRGGPARLGYSDGRGDVSLRRALARWLRHTRGVVASPDNLIVVQGSQMGLDLVARTLLRPGDIAVVEEPGYPPLRAALLARGARLLPLPVDPHGLDVDALCDVDVDVRAVFVTPHHQYPTTVSLAPERRARLLAWAAARRVAIVEDDYDHEFHFRGQPLAPLLADDRAGVVVHVGSLSKILAPGLRKGFVCGPRAVVSALLRARRSVDRQGDAVMEAAIAELIDDGELLRHARRMRRLYRERRDVLIAALRATFGAAIDVDVPAGGMALWLRVSDGTDVARWRRAARRRGLVLQATESLYLAPTVPTALRLGFAGNAPAVLIEAVRRLALAHADARSGAERRRAR